MLQLLTIAFSFPIHHSQSCFHSLLHNLCRWKSIVK